MSDPDYQHNGEEQDRPIETTSVQTVDDADSDATDTEVLDDAGGLFTPTRQDGRLLPVTRESEQFDRELTLNPVNQSRFDQFFNGRQVADITAAEWADFIAATLVDPDPQQYAQMYGKAEVNESFVRENVGQDAREEIAALALKAGGYSEAALNLKGLMTEKERQQFEAMLSADEVDLGNLAAKAQEAESSPSSSES